MTLKRTLAAGMTWGCIGACSYFAAVADEPKISIQQTPVAAHRAVVRELFGANLLANNARNVMVQSGRLAPSEGFDMLAEWVLPSETHAKFRMTSFPGAWDLDSGEPLGLRSPAIELVQQAKVSRRLDELRELISQIPESSDRTNRCAQQTLLLLVALANSDVDASEQHANSMVQMIGRDAIPWKLRECAVIVGWAAQQNPQLEEIVCPMFVDEHQFVKRSGRVGGQSSWQKYVSQFAGWTKMRQAAQDDQPYSDKPDLKNWVPATPLNSQDYAQGSYGAYWLAVGKSVAKFPDSANNLLFYRWPLLGNFEVTLQLSSFSFDPVQIMYAGRWLSVNPDQTRIRTGNLRVEAELEIDGKVSEPRGSARYIMTVKDNKVRVVFNGREVHRFELDESHDPWLAIRYSAPFSGQIEDLSVHGSPSVPSSVPLITSEQMDEWISWRPSHLVGPHDNAAWTLTSDSTNKKVLTGRKRIDLLGTDSESLINHYRPIIQTGTIKYDYFYAPGKSLVHPALGQRAMLIRPGEILFRDLIAATYEHDQPADYEPLSDGVSVSRFAAEILKQNDWNTVEVFVNENTFRLAINGVDVCNGEIPRHNARTFGLFHFADRTEARVRNIEWTGDWSDRIPDSSEQLTDQAMARLDKTAETLTAVFEHDFVESGLDTNYFSTKGDTSQIVQNSELGVEVTSETSANDFGSISILPNFEITGDFDIEAEFSDFRVDGERTGSARIKIGHANTERVIARFLRLDQQRGFKTIGKDSNGSLPEIKMVSDATSGRLRIARRGTTYSFAFAEVGSSRFYLLATETGTAEPIAADGWNLAVTSQAETRASVVWKNLRVSAERLRYFPSKKKN